MTTIREQLLTVALDKGLRLTTLRSYEVLMARVLDLDTLVEEVSQEAVLEALWALDNPNTRRATIVALRSILGWSVRIPRAVPRRYDLPSEDTLRLALMTSPHEVRGLAMLYGGLRVGEACAVNASDVAGDRLRVVRQVVQIHRKGHPTVVRLAPTKGAEAEIYIPAWLGQRIATLDGWVKPDAVRESIRRAGRRVGAEINPHMLRHAYATMLLARGVPLITVSRQMRHSDPAITMRTYAQASDAKEIRDALG